jgi:putative hemolysin
MTYLLLYLALALIVSFLCSIIESVLLSTPISYLNVRENMNDKDAISLKIFKIKIDKPLSAILSLNTIAHTIGAAGVGAQATIVFGEAYFGIVSAVLTLLILIFTEIIPKTIGARYWKSMIGFSVKTIQIMIVLTYPLVLISGYLSKAFANNNNDNSITEDEIKVMFKVAQNEGVLDSEETALHHQLFNFNDKKAHHLMTHRSDVEWIDINDSFEEIAAQMKTSQHAYFPACDENMDNILGILHNKEFFELYKDDENKNRDIKNILSEAIYIPETLTALKVLSIFKEKKYYFGIVLDEYGTFIGVVTLHDLAEGILGELPSFGEEEDPDIVEREDQSFLVDGFTPITDFNDKINHELIPEESEFATVAGFFVNQINALPKTGDIIEHNGYRFEIVDMDGNRIDKFIISKISTEKNSDNSKDN